MKAKEELLHVRQRLSGRIDVLRADLEIVDASIRLIEREGRLEPTDAPLQQSEACGAFAKMGLTNCCLQILGARNFISPAKVRDLLIQGGYPKSNKTKLLGSVYSTLKRLHGAGKLEFRKPHRGGRKYRVKQHTAEPSEE